MKKLLLSTALALFVSGAHAATLPILNGAGASVNTNVGTDPSTGNVNPGISNSYSITNATSTLTLPATTTAYTAGQAIASSATAGSVVVPSFTIPNTAGGFYLPAMLLTTTDPAWSGAVVQIDTWRVAPTLTNGDRGAYLIATGSASYLGSYACALTSAGDGSYSACAPTVGTTPAVRLASGTSVFWTIQTTTGTTSVTAASGVFTLTAELSN